MLEGLSFQDPLVVNAIGHTAGLFLFGLMIVLLLQDWKRNGIRQARLSLLAAVLALLWNLGGLFVLAISNAKPALQDALMTFSFVVLSLLPAVLFQLVLKSRLKWATNLGYLLSFTAAVLHIVENFLLSSRIHQAALTTIYAGFSLLIVCAAIFGQTKEKPAPSH